MHYNTLNLKIFKPNGFKYNPVNRGPFFERLKQSLSKGWFGFVDLLLFMFKIWPFWLIVALALYLWKRFKKRKKKKH